MTDPGGKDFGGGYRPLLWAGLAVASGLYILLLNGGPLYYFDSAGYLETGIKTLRFLGLVTDPASGAGAASARLADDGVINGSRSVTYSIIVSAATYWLGVNSVPLLHMAGVLAVTAFLVGILMRGAALAGRGGVMRVTALALTAAGLGSLPFYVAYFMPDILTAPMLLSIAVLVVAWPRMAWWEIALVLVFAITAVLSHPSHLLIAAVMVPVVALAGIWVWGRRWWVPTALVLVMVGAGAGERLAFTEVARERLDAEVTYYPFLTARLIEDGVGYQFLGERCPDPGLETCTLYDALQRSDDPKRLTATNIVFQVGGPKASFRDMSPQMQGRIAAEQVDFAIQTFLAHPFATGFAVMSNTFVQARRVSARMTISDPDVVEKFQTLPNYPPGSFESGRLTRSPGWIPFVDALHYGYYAASLAVLGLLFFRPGGMSPEMRILVLLALAGIAANAFVCGAVSQPANRYGARVIWLLPFLAALAILLRPAPPDRVPGTARRR